jgi:hypothetical protein
MKFLQELSAVNEAFKINDKVKIISGPNDVVGKEGYIGEIRTDVQGKKTYTIDYETKDGRTTSVMLKPFQIRTIKEAVVHSKGIHIDYKGHGDFEVMLDGEKYEVYCPIDVRGDHGDDSEWAGKFQVTKDGIRLSFTDPAYKIIDEAFDKLDPVELASHDMEGR